MNQERHLSITREDDIITARRVGREMAEPLGFSISELTLISTALSEITRNIVEHAGQGEVEIKVEDNGARRGIIVVARDEGPGISDIELAMRDGYSSKNGLGLGLPGANRIMDEFEIVSASGAGTTITMKKWIR